MCVFCNLENLTVLFQNTKCALIQDIKPAALHHYLVIPKEHHRNPRYLDKTHEPLIREMKTVAIDYLKDVDPNLNFSDIRMGFHWSPFNSIEHLHLHVIYPISTVPFYRSQVYKPNSYWFCDVDETIRILLEKN